MRSDLGIIDRHLDSNKLELTMIEQIDHINIVVNDLEKMIHFYEKRLGFKLSKRVEISGLWIERVVGLKEARAEVVYLELLTGPRIELIHYLSPVGQRPHALDIPNTMGMRHMAFRVRGIETWVTRLKKEGISFFGEIQEVPVTQVTYAGGVQKRLVYFHDPEGNILELCEYSA